MIIHQSVVLLGVQGISYANQSRAGGVSFQIPPGTCSVEHLHLFLEGPHTLTPLPGATANTTSPPWKCAQVGHMSNTKANMVGVGTEYRLSSCSTTQTVFGFNQYCLITHRTNQITLITKRNVWRADILYIPVKYYMGTICKYLMCPHIKLLFCSVIERIAP